LATSMKYSSHEGRRGLRFFSKPFTGRPAETF
jgi:hypothetical protein